MKLLYIFLYFLIFSVKASAQATPSQDDSLIRASRAKMNELMSSHDARGMGRYWTQDYVRISGAGNFTVSKDSSVAYWTRTFKQQPTIYYVRTPLQIIVSEDGSSAWEHGTWEGFNTKSKGGNYAAVWTKQDNIWKLQSETFITLSHY